MWLSFIFLLLGSGCDDPTAQRQPPELRAMTLFLILDPDMATQPLLIKTAEPADRLDHLLGEVFLDDQVVSSVYTPGETPSNEHRACAERYGTISGVALPRCLEFDFRPIPGATYRVVTSADAHPTASAATVVPGDFQITYVDARGDPPGSEGLEVRWTRSEGVYRYVVAVRPQTASCIQRNDCDQGWFAATADTTLTTTVPEEEFAAGEGPWYVDVYAMDRALFQYLTTGAAGNLFPVPSVQNVAGGFGAVGAWVRRYEPL